ncbi:N-acetyl-D-glucosamine kinase protein [Marine Group I thaumarchaeote SCGC AAA799-P11]|uniref:N-acetyl-D-glucosamine kinase protein n=1 Tax=Marine Group I thaumarchaeote SCGC AAA799-P11 TaxID=1502295 RepID=A0A087RYE5_9ARCH|nr:N-acetyl-D-glucosamine kinase protein [Marine Group I thaumarchaeote SCGC AAA799-P11]
MYKLGVDLGGTKIEAILLDDSLNVLERKRISTPKENYFEIVDVISNLVSEISSNVSDFSLGICAPGAISKKTGLIKNSNTQCLIGKPLKEDLEEKLNKSVSMENDANCFVMAESKMGSAKQFDFVFGVIMGTGVGGGIVVNGKLHSGRTNIAGEWGHHTLHHNGNPCYCGKTGCVETYISGSALEKKWELLSGQTKPMPEILSNLDNDVGKKWKNEFLENFGFGLANVIDILDPDAIVLGGGLSNIDFLYTEGKNSVYEKVFSDSVDTPILKNKLGDSAGVYGAALLN